LALREGGDMTVQQRKKMALTLVRFVESMQAWNWSNRTIVSYEQNVRYFIEWLAAETDVETLAEVTAETLASYQTALLSMEKPDGERFSVSTRNQRVTALKSFFRYLAEEGKLLADPAASLRHPKQRRRLPQPLLTPKEAIRLLESVETITPLGLRDRAILEVLYATGVRNAELRGLQLTDFDPSGETLTVSGGKGNKDRVVPLGPVSAAIVGDYITQARPKIAFKSEVRNLFVTKNGLALDPKLVITIVRRHLEHAGIDRPIRPHRLRHACATHMLKGGADIRHIQKLLGHASLQSTQIYTHVEISDLKAAHRRFHPRERRR
jgi:integrase/recombinase XerD